ncbi:hypothetical protein MGU_00372 [Metarhizium guizhouense ARSEF 977]|uniref:Uncharacterized protein n=1 Tax=Metarhizium guizhouense (strain ARSEF 977) TaxID=1276136 RepID=A0A0B4HBG3_METGA|nr:hypothetical protein MGU_00372 [Metarhizium guizhouense ARSEF 977]
MGHTSEPDSGMKRAAEVSEAMLSVPGYADDSMFFTVRYGHKAKETLRKCDYDELMETLNKMTALWSKSGGGGAKPEPGAEERHAQIMELRRHCLEIIKDFPDLVRDFDRFRASSKAALSAVMRSNT